VAEVITLATTRLIPLHIGRGGTIRSALSGSLEYIEDPEKTDGGELITSYECAPQTADAEFTISKNIYSVLTGRNQGGKDVIAYHTRQSFRPGADGLPGEVTPEEANEIGRELAMRFTHGKHAFVVCTHIDKHHVHNHIIWNSTRLDCKGKFRNFLGSSFALRRVSDRLCAEHGLSIVKNPKYSRGHYGTWLGGDRPLSFQERLRQAIDEAISKKPSDFESFLSLMMAAGFEIKRGKHLAFKVPADGFGPAADKFTRCREKTLGADYTEKAIRERIAGRRIASGETPALNWSRQTPGPEKKISLLIDIQSKIQQGKGAGYRQWATLFNLKEAARTLVYLQEQGIGNYDALAEKAAAATARFNAATSRMKELETALSDNAELQKQIVTYSKTRAAYADYKASGYSKDFRAGHEADIILHQAAKKYFDSLGYGRDKKLPRVADLRTDYAEQLSEKKKLYAEHKEARAGMRELLTAKANADRILGLPDISPVAEREIERENTGR
jgi:hypothetical protein